MSQESFELLLGYFLDYVENKTQAAKDDLLEIIALRGEYDMDLCPDQNIIKLAYEMGLEYKLEDLYPSLDLN